MKSTFFTLMAEFETADIPLEACCEKYFGLSPKSAKQMANYQRLPVPVFKAGSQKSAYLISAHDLADYLDSKKEEARHDWERINEARIATRATCRRAS